MIEWAKRNKQARTSSAFMKKRWAENREEMVAICSQGGSVKGRVRPSPSVETRRRISDTLKRKGCHPPWELSPCVQGGYRAVELFGVEIAEKKKQATIKANKNKVYSDETREKLSFAKRGENNPNWKGGITSERNRLCNTWETRVWREAVFQRDKYTCRECGDSNTYLNAHHIMEVSQYPELRFNVENGKTLCIGCHKITANYGGKWVR